MEAFPCKQALSQALPSLDSHERSLLDMESMKHIRYMEGIDSIPVQHRGSKSNLEHLT